MNLVRLVVLVPLSVYAMLSAMPALAVDYTIVATHPSQTFNDPLAWTPLGPPGATDRAIVVTPWDVVFNSDVSTAELLVNNSVPSVAATPKLQLGGHQYQANAVNVLPATGNSATLTIRNGAVVANSMTLGNNSRGRLFVDASTGPTSLQTGTLLALGGGPNGELQVLNGAQLTTTGLAELKRMQVVLSGAGTKWTADEVILGDATLSRPTTLELRGAQLTADSIVAHRSSNVRFYDAGTTGSQVTYNATLQVARFGEIAVDKASSLTSLNTNPLVTDLLIGESGDFENWGVTTVNRMSVLGTAQIEATGVFNGNIDVSGGLDVRGVVHGAVTLNSGSVYSQAAIDSIVDDMIWRGGATVQYTLFHVDEFDFGGLVNVAGILDLQGTSSDPLRIDLRVIDYNPETDGTDFVIANASGGITGFDPAAFRFLLNGSEFGYPYASTVTQHGDSLVLHAIIPEPTSVVLLFAGLVTFVSLSRKLRRARTIRQQR